MKAIGYQQNLPVDNIQSLQDIELAMPKAQGQDILVEVKAVSVNPADFKIRLNMPAPESGWNVLGYDATGIVKSVGANVSLFKPGDKVWYAGDVTRSGSNAEYQLVDERIVGHMPTSLSYADAASLPLTAITAWELLFDRLQVDATDKNKRILVIGAAGGVGSGLRLNMISANGAVSTCEADHCNDLYEVPTVTLLRVIVLAQLQSSQ